MKFIYEKFDLLKLLKQGMFDNLQSLFSMLLMKLAGDVDEALHVMEALQNEGYIDDNIDLQDFQDLLEEKKIIQRDPLSDGYRLSHLGNFKLREHAFEEIFAKLKRGRVGEHVLEEAGGSPELSSEKRPYHFGDEPRSIDYLASMLNTVRREASLDLMMNEDDLEVYESDRTSDLAVSLLIDISHSMVLYGEDRITPAKKLALALTHYIKTRFPKDDLSIVLFGDTAQEIHSADLMKLSAGPYHTNTQMGLRKARQILLQKKQVNKQIIMITDGKPSIIKLNDGSYYKNPFGLDPKIVNRTLNEAILCRKRSIPITTFMIANDPSLIDFVHKLTKVNCGKAFYCDIDNLESFVIENFMNNRKSRLY